MFKYLGILQMEFLVIRKKNYLKNFPSSATAYLCILGPNLINWFELRRWITIRQFRFEQPIQSKRFRNWI